MTHTACTYPGCRDTNNQPRLTEHGMCLITNRRGNTIGGCQTKFRDDIRQLALDWAQLHATLPTPARNIKTPARTTNRQYGHPAQWASDTSAHIARLFNDIHRDLAHTLASTPPPQKHTSEPTRIRAAWKFIEPRIHQLAQQSWSGQTATDIRKLHNQIRRHLGHSAPVETLPVYCPNPDCSLRTLQRRIRPGNDTISCANCGYTVTDDPDGNNYRWLIRVCIDSAIDTTQPAHATENTTHPCVLNN